MAGPTLAEVVRRLEELVSKIDQLATRMEVNYVRKDVYDADQRAAQIVHKGIGDDVAAQAARIDLIEETAAANRKLVVTSIIAPIVVGVVVVLIISALGAHK